jgi:hypothetical protein
MAAGLRAQILFRSFHGRAKMRGRMPRPARIVEYGARESDKIGIASSNDRLIQLGPTGIFCAGLMPPLET